MGRKNDQADGITKEQSTLTLQERWDLIREAEGIHESNTVENPILPIKPARWQPLPN